MMLSTSSIMEVVNEIPCGRAAHILTYIFKASDKYVRFGKDYQKISDFCNRWKDVPCRAVQVIAYCGPPGARRMFRLTIAQIMRDYLMNAYVTKDRKTVDLFLECIGYENK